MHRNYLMSILNEGFNKSGDYRCQIAQQITLNTQMERQVSRELALRYPQAKTTTTKKEQEQDVLA